MKKFLVLGFLAALYAAIPSASYAEDVADAIFCRQEEIVAVQIPQALEKDAVADAKGEESGGDSFYLTLTDTLIGDGNCIEMSHVNVVFTGASQTWCSKTTPDACFVHGPAVAKLPEEAGNHFVNGFAILPKEDAASSVVDASKGDLEVVLPQSPVLAATTP